MADQKQEQNIPNPNSSQPNYPFQNTYQQPYGFNDPFHSFLFGPGPHYPSHQQGFPYPGNQDFQGPQMNQGQQQLPNPQSVHPFVHSFMDKNGNFDFNKVMAGMDNIYKMVNKTGPMLKQLSPLFNMFKR